MPRRNPHENRGNATPRVPLTTPSAPEPPWALIPIMIALALYLLIWPASVNRAERYALWATILIDNVLPFAAGLISTGIGLAIVRSKPVVLTVLAVLSMGMAALALAIALIVA
jgi:hypothetical protein